MVFIRCWVFVGDKHFTSNYGVVGFLVKIYICITNTIGTNKNNSYYIEDFFHTQNLIFMRYNLNRDRLRAK